MAARCIKRDLLLCMTCYLDTPLQLNIGCLRPNRVVACRARLRQSVNRPALLPDSSADAVTAASRVQAATSRFFCFRTRQEKWKCDCRKRPRAQLQAYAQRRINSTLLVLHCAIKKLRESPYAARRGQTSAGPDPGSRPAVVAGTRGQGAYFARRCAGGGDDDNHRV